MIVLLLILYEETCANCGCFLLGLVQCEETLSMCCTFAMADIDKSVLLCDNCDDDKKFIEL